MSLWSVVHQLSIAVVILQIVLAIRQIYLSVYWCDLVAFMSCCKLMLFSNMTNILLFYEKNRYL